MEYRVISLDALRPMFEHFLQAPVVTPDPRQGPNFIWSTLDLAAYYRAHQTFSEPFRERNSVSLESVIAVIAALIVHLYVTWNKVPDYFLSMWQRVYDMPGKPEEIRAVDPRIGPDCHQIKRTTFRGVGRRCRSGIQLPFVDGPIAFPN